MPSLSVYFKTPPITRYGIALRLIFCWSALGSSLTNDESIRNSITSEYQLTPCTSRSRDQPGLSGVRVPQQARGNKPIPSSSISHSLPNMAGYSNRLSTTPTKHPVSSAFRGFVSVGLGGLIVTKFGRLTRSSPGQFRNWRSSSTLRHT
ncbi:hypothetical protein F4680DRAFT_293243 [Xylaria scruposa]|nr:hypothetical protein F4680DRAFT_293243 [Xylaria scruposa]